MKIALSGASGFIGQHVLQELLRRQHQVCALTHRPLNVSHPNLHTIQLDLHHPPEDSYQQLGNPDCFIHLAWHGLPHYTALRHFEDELPKQYLFLKQLIQAGLPKLFVSGSCAEYGMQSGALHEQLPALPNTPYAWAKHALHQQLRYLQAHFNYQLTWGRLFYIYGPGQPSHSLYSQLQKAIQDQKGIFNMSGGEQLRDYLPVQQAAAYIVDLATADQTGLFNICSGQPISVRKLVENWLTESNANIQLNLGHYPYPEYETMAFWGNRDRLDGALHANHTISGI